MCCFKTIIFWAILVVSTPECASSDVAFFVGLIPILPKPIPNQPPVEPAAEPKPIALQSVVVSANVRAWAVGVTADLTYRNMLNQTIECQFVFPMADTAAVYKLEAVFGSGRKIKAEIHARKEAEQIYQQAVESGHQAVLLQNQKGSTDIYRILLGNLAPNETAKVTVGYAQPMDRDPDNSVLSLTLPVVLNPRYVPVHELLDADAMQRNFHVTVPYVAVSQVSYTMKFSAKVDIGLDGKIVDIKPGNSSDLLDVKVEGSEKRIANVTLMGNFRQDHDFRLLITTEKSLKPAVYVEPGVESSDDSGVANPWLGYHVAAAWFEPVQVADTVDAPSKDEYWLVIDRSGSMDGQKIADAREALLLFVRSLPFGCTFNIIGFGSTFQVLFQEGVVTYNETTMRKAVNHAETVTADLSGTEILEPFQYIYNQPLPTAPGSKRFIVILTDGEVSNTEEVIAIAQRNVATTRVFAIGIGEGASTALIDGVTRVSNGMSDYVRSSSDRLQAKVVGLLKATTLPAADNFTLVWNMTGGQVVVKEPNTLPLAAFRGRSIMQFAVIQRQANIVGAFVNMSALVSGKQMSFQLPFNISNEAVAPAGDDDSMPLHRLAAKARLVNLTDEYRRTSLESVKQEAVAISLATGVLCEFTSYVAVDSETRRQVNDSQGRPLFVNIERPSEYEWAPGYGNRITAASAGFGPSSVLRIIAGPSVGSGSSIGMSNQPPSPSYNSYSYDLAEDAEDEYKGDYDKALGPPPPPPPPAGVFYTTTFPYLPTFLTTTVVPRYLPTIMTWPTTTYGSLPPTTTPQRTLANLLNLQNFDGSWTLNAALVNSVGSSNITSVASMKNVISGALLQQVPRGNEDTIYGTLTGIAILRRQFANSRGEWELIEDKAIKFLRSKGLQTANIDTYVNTVANALQL